MKKVSRFGRWITVTVANHIVLHISRSARDSKDPFAVKRLNEKHVNMSQDSGTILPASQ